MVNFHFLGIKLCQHGSPAEDTPYLNILQGAGGTFMFGRESARPKHIGTYGCVRGSIGVYFKVAEDRCFCAQIAVTLDETTGVYVEDHTINELRLQLQTLLVEEQRDARWSLDPRWNKLARQTLTFISTDSSPSQKQLVEVAKKIIAEFLSKTGWSKIDLKNFKKDRVKDQAGFIIKQSSGKIKHSGKTHGTRWVPTNEPSAQAKWVVTVKGGGPVRADSRGAGGYVSKTLYSNRKDARSEEGTGVVKAAGREEGAADNTESTSKVGDEDAIRAIKG